MKLTKRERASILAGLKLLSDAKARDSKAAADVAYLATDCGTCEALELNDIAALCAQVCGTWMQSAPKFADDAKRERFAT